MRQLVCQSPVVMDHLVLSDHDCDLTGPMVTDVRRDRTLGVCVLVDDWADGLGRSGQCRGGRRCHPDNGCAYRGVPEEMTTRWFIGHADAFHR